MVLFPTGFASLNRGGDWGSQCQMGGNGYQELNFEMEVLKTEKRENHAERKELTIPRVSPMPRFPNIFDRK